jgi:photosystem II stability/assembly factor-like uncharacterized protein
VVPPAEEKQEAAAGAASAPAAITSTAGVTAQPETPAAAAPSQGAAIAGRARALGLTRAPIQIVSPNPSNRWRVAAGGAVEFSTTGGASWRAAVAPAGRVLAGSAPEPLVCWLVGQAGFVALTTDGEAFRQIPFPEAVDLASISASDASTAVVTTANQGVYRTSNGGKSWTAEAP